MATDRYHCVRGYIETERTFVPVAGWVGRDIVDEFVEGAQGQRGICFCHKRFNIMVRPFLLNVFQDQVWMYT